MSDAEVDELDTKIVRYLAEAYPQPTTVQTLAKVIATSAVENVRADFRRRISKRLQVLKRKGTIAHVIAHYGSPLGWRLKMHATGFQ